jgi:hypothetical protein
MMLSFFENVWSFQFRSSVIHQPSQKDDIDHKETDGNARNIEAWNEA